MMRKNRAQITPGAAFTLPDGSVLPPFRLGAWLLFSLGFCDDAYLSLLGSAKAPELMTILHLLYNNGWFCIDDETYNALDSAMRMLQPSACQCALYE